MDAKRLLRLQGDLTRYLDDVLPDLGRRNRRPWAELYLRGLLLDGGARALAPWPNACNASTAARRTMSRGFSSSLARAPGTSDPSATNSPSTSAPYLMPMGR